MDRRSFIAAAAAGGAVALPQAASATPGGDRVTECVVLRAALTNTELFPAAPRPAMNARLRLERHPHRRFDPASIAVLSPEGAPLGYLPPVRSATLAALMDAGVTAEARRLQDTPGGRMVVGVIVQVPV
jgi:hypothetical protein